MTDKILEVMVEELERGMDPEKKDNSYEIEIFGNKTEERPKFLSATFMTRIQNILSILNGSINPNDGTYSESAGLLIKALTGRSRQGYGAGHVAVDDITKRSMDVRWKIRENLPVAVREAIKDYLAREGETIEEKKKRGKRSKFVQLSTDPVEEYIDGKKKLRPIPKRFKPLLTRWTQNMHNIRYIDTAAASVINEKTVRRFTDTDGRKIKDSHMLNSVHFHIKFSHVSGKPLLYEQGFIPPSWNRVYARLEKMLANAYSDIDQMRFGSELIPNIQHVVMGPGASAYFIHEAFSHLLSGHHLKEMNTTTFKGRIGSRITKNFIDIIAETSSDGAGHYLRDAEGIRPKDEVLVSRGILRGRLYDRDSAGHYRKPSNGHARQGWVSESGDPLPAISRAGILRLVSHEEYPEEEIMEMMKKDCKRDGRKYGVYIHSFREGTVDLAKGRFVLEPQLAYKVFNDGSRECITNFILVGSIYDALNNIKAVGDTYETSTGYCGGWSGDVPTEETSSALYIKNLTAIPLYPGAKPEDFL